MKGLFATLQVYDYAAKPIINGVHFPSVFVQIESWSCEWAFSCSRLRLRGFNGTVFAYGVFLSAFLLPPSA